MKIYKLILIAVFLFNYNFSFSQEEFALQDNFKTIKFDTYIKVLRTSDSILPNTFFYSLAANWEENEVSYGFSPDFYWLRFKLRNTASFAREVYFTINNPHIKHIEFYKIIDEKLKLNYKCGDYLPYNTRPIDSEKFVFPIKLEEGESATYFVKIDKRNTSVSFPTYLMTSKEFVKQSTQANLLNGILYGGLILCAFFSLLSFLYLKRFVHLWYCLYTIAIGLYLFTTMGYSFRYLYPNTVIFTSFFRIVLLIFGVIFLLKFTQLILKTRIYIKKNYHIINVIIYGFLLILFVWLLFPNFYRLYITVMVKLVYLFMLFSLLSFFFTAFFTYKKQKNIVKLYLLSFGPLFLSGFITLLLEFGLVPEMRLKIPFLLIGGLIQVLILGVGLFNEIRLIYKEKNDLSLKVIQKQQKITEAYINGMEEERLRISNELHDDIGSQLANIVRYADHENIQSPKLRDKLVNTIDDVRRISHQLTPNTRLFSSFEERLKNLIEETFLEENVKCKLHFSIEDKVLNDSQELSLYRITQEALNNIVKHSKANIIEVQYLTVENELTLIIEDNGIGFDNSTVNKGNGLLNIQKRVDYLKGQMELSSYKNKGTYITISIPLES